ncbi:MAG TPA: hypothetical protein VJT15_24850 [Pyrinomonadaceae bacterium]|nr:hypothetical protein [Pyrinomonadaceae bacterium]
MDQPTVTFNNLDHFSKQSQAARWARACFKTAICLRMIQPALVFAGAAFVVVLSTAFPVAAQTGGPIITGGNPNAPITGIQNLVTLGVWLLIAAGIGGIGWALVNGMRRQSWGAQLIFGAACLGFGGIVALWNEYANGRSPDLPAF